MGRRVATSVVYDSGIMHVRAAFGGSMNEWQIHCTEELNRCVQFEENCPGVGRAEWEKVRHSLSTAKRVVIADADFLRASLRGFNFTRCYIIRVNFSRADLANAEFHQAILRNCDLAYAQLDGADLSLADFRRSKINFATPVEQIRGVRPHLGEVIRNQQFRADLAVDGGGFALRVWNRATDYGNSITRVLLISVAIILIFGVIFYLTQDVSGPSLGGGHESLGRMVAFSAENFLNSAPSYTASNLVIRLLVISNVALGVGALGVFIAVLSRKLIAYIR